MATRVAETCRWLLCNKTTFIHSSAPVGFLKMFNISYECTEHGAYQTKNRRFVSLFVVPVQMNLRPLTS
jgi:hypothetical protein